PRLMIVPATAEVPVDAFGREASLANRPDHQRCASHDVARGEDAFERRLEVRADLQRAMAGDPEGRLAEERRYLLGLESERGDDELRLEPEPRALHRGRAAAALGVGRAEPSPDR